MRDLQAQLRLLLLSHQVVILSVSRTGLYLNLRRCSRRSSRKPVRRRTCAPWNAHGRNKLVQRAKRLALHGIVLTSAVPIILVALMVFVLLAFAGVVGLSLALRYRAGTSRRQARRWVATMNVWMTSFSAALFLFVAFLMSFWFGPTIRFALTGMAIGVVVGLLGLALTRWEVEPEGLFYTPSRWLALLITFAITARFLYGWWHATHPGNRAGDNQHWLMSASATQLSFAVAAGLIGYYLIYAIGVSLRLRRYQRPRSV